MATYDDWNDALALAFTRGVAPGTPVYLAVDHEVLDSIGFSAWGPCPVPGRAWHEDFRLALGEVTGQGVNLAALRRQRPGDSPPRCVGFLAAMVLAASRMAEDEHASELAYFRRLCELLDINPPPGMTTSRPAGIEHSGDEEPLWLEWNRWLLRQGLLPTAQRGPEGAHKFIHYPLSQALLREADRQKLDATFRRLDTRIPAYCDPATLAAIISSEAKWPTAHLRAVMGEDGSRRSAAEEAVFEAFEAWRLSGGPGAGPVATRQRLIAGLFREEDPILGGVEYRLFPRMRRGVDPGVRPRVTNGGEAFTLRRLRPGWYEPVWSVEAEALNEGLELGIEGLPGISSVELPERPFWVLVSDPEDPESGLFASWGPPRLGEPFFLLARAELRRDLELLRDEKLFQWEGEPVESLPGWLEYRDALAVAESWAGVHTTCPQLELELRPSATLAISLTGGLRTPAHTWLANYGPTVVVHGFEQDGEVVLYDEAGGPTRSVPFRVNTPVEGLTWSRPGAYRVEAQSGGERSPPRLVRIESWDTLRRADPLQPEAQRLTGATVRGALLVVGDER